ncbi:MAG TPA: PDZ domain-containing protein [Aggregatilineales bacterium]|nr:PDZ domain-containing protein [Aggregatilineales bacterium]
MRKIASVLSISIVVMALAAAFAGVASAQETSERAWIGVSIADSDNGVEVRDVVNNSPAEAAGIERGDVILSVDGSAVETAQALIDSLGSRKPEDTITLNLNRDGEEMTIDVTLGVYPEDNFEQDQRRPRIEMFGEGANMLPMLGVILEESDEGWVVTRVIPMMDSEFEEGDIITAINGESVNDMSLREAFEMMLNTEDSLEVTVLRDGETMTITIESPAGRVFQFAPDGAIAGSRVLLGVQYQALDETFAANLGIDTTEGALITQVVPESPAAAAGLMSGDIVSAVDGTPVNADNTLTSLIGGHEAGDTVTLTVLRAGESMDIEVTLEVQDFPMPFPGGDGFDFNFPRDGRDGFRFEFDGLNEQLGELFDNLEGSLPTNGEPFSVVCTDDTGNTVFSLEFGTGRRDLFITPDLELDGLDFSKLNCEVGTGDNAEPQPPSNSTDSDA